MDWGEVGGLDWGREWVWGGFKEEDSEVLERKTVKFWKGVSEAASELGKSVAAREDSVEAIGG